MIVKELIKILERFPPYYDVSFVGQEGRKIKLDEIDGLDSFEEVQFAFDVED